MMKALVAQSCKKYKFRAETMLWNPSLALHEHDKQSKLLKRNIKYCTLTLTNKKKSFALSLLVVKIKMDVGSNVNFQMRTSASGLLQHILLLHYRS
jgi:hypothetical protein